MAARNYQPTLRRLMHVLSLYIGRYQTFLAAGMSSDEASALATLQSALDVLIGLLGTGSGV